MKPIARLVFAVVPALALAACEGMRHDQPGYVYVDGYYDDFYGPFYDGYWGDGGYFYYRTGPDADWRRDDARHFRHEAGEGFNNFHVRAGVQGSHDGQAPASGRRQSTDDAS
jgi:hypothetical protein